MGGYDAAPSRPAPRQAPAAPAARPQPKPAPNFSDMDDDIPF
jgi:single-strand DNA-binding protein